MSRFIRKIYNSILAGSFFSSVMNWFFYKKKIFIYRLAFYFGLFSKNDSLPNEWFDINTDFSVLPGNRDLINKLFVETKINAEGYNTFKSILNHNLRILSSETFNISEFAKALPDEFYSLVDSLPSEKVQEYKPINWNRDFKSGKEWPIGMIFFDKVYSPQEGADIKVPWELSRFVHVGYLIHGNKEEGAIEFMLQTSDWIISNPRFTGVNWSSELIVSIRAINFIWGISMFYEVLIKYPKILNSILISIYYHRLFLEKNMAYYRDSTDDHYLGNIVALAYISMLLPNLPKSDEWLLFSYQQLCSEMERQVQTDGFSYMMSSGYHRFVTELFLSATCYIERMPQKRYDKVSKLKRLSIKPDPSSMKKNGMKYHFSVKRKFPDWYYSKLFLMGNVINALIKPNGKVVQFGDNDSARAHKLFSDLFDESIDHRSTLLLISAIFKLYTHHELESGIFPLTESQIVVGDLNLSLEKQIEFSNYKNKVLLFDKAKCCVYSNELYYIFVSASPNGYNGLGGHGHNDKCSFEFNYKGSDFFVDGGCPFYTSNIALRNEYRSIKAHNTFLVDNLEQDDIIESEIFSLKQSKSNPQIRIETNSEVFTSHDGFGITCSRRFSLLDHQIIIDDYVPVESINKRINFNLHPEVEIITVDKRDFDYVTLLKSGENTLEIIIKNANSWNQEKGYYGIGYGQDIKTLSLQFYFSGDNLKTIINCL
jgi:hypothetical protein